MATKTQQQSASPFSRLSRLGLGLGLKSQPSSTYSHDTKVDDDDWYIAYNGPYEVPKDLRKRDSWGDVIEEEGADMVLHDASLIRRYQGVGRDSGYMDGADYRRGRAHSTTSRLTTSSVTIDSSRRSMRSPPRRTTHSKRGGPMSSYINLDAAGGVGESPMPAQRSPTPSTSANRTSIVNFFLGAPSTSGRKLVRSPSTTNLVHSARTSTSVDVSRPRHQSLSVVPEPMASTSEDDYYNSYYSTLIATPKKLNKSRPRVLRVNSTSANPSLESEKAPTSPTSPASSPTAQTALHPYAYTLPGSRPVTRAPREGVPPVLPATFPILQTHQIPKGSVSSGCDHHVRVPAQTLQSVSPPTIHSGTAVVDALKISSAIPLRSSASVPNLRIVQTQQRQSPGPPLLPTGVERWLSAETWCDAMIFPRPRFKIQHGHGAMETVSEGRRSGKSSGRIVSPPPTPIARFADDIGTRGKYVFPKKPEQDGAATAPSLQPRLSKSRSATNLKLASTPKDLSPILDPVSASPNIASGSKDKATVKAKLQKPRPKHLLLDDRALKSVPSLNQ